MTTSGSTELVAATLDQLAERVADTLAGPPPGTYSRLPRCRPSSSEREPLQMPTVETDEPSARPRASGRPLYCDGSVNWAGRIKATVIGRGDKCHLCNNLTKATCRGCGNWVCMGCARAKRACAHHGGDQDRGQRDVEVARPGDDPNGSPIFSPIFSPILSPNFSPISSQHPPQRLTANGRPVAGGAAANDAVARDTMGSRGRAYAYDEDEQAHEHRTAGAARPGEDPFDGQAAVPRTSTSDRPAVGGAAVRGTQEHREYAVQEQTTSWVGIGSHRGHVAQGLALHPSLTAARGARAELLRRLAVSAPAGPRPRLQSLDDVAPHPGGHQEFHDEHSRMEEGERADEGGAPTHARRSLEGGRPSGELRTDGIRYDRRSHLIRALSQPRRGGDGSLVDHYRASLRGPGARLTSLAREREGGSRHSASPHCTNDDDDDHDHPFMHAASHAEASGEGSKPPPGDGGSPRSDANRFPRGDEVVASGSMIDVSDVAGAAACATSSALPCFRVCSAVLSAAAVASDDVVTTAPTTPHAECGTVPYASHRAFPTLHPPDGEGQRTTDTRTDGERYSVNRRL